MAEDRKRRKSGPLATLHFIKGILISHDAEKHKECRCLMIIADKVSMELKETYGE